MLLLLNKTFVSHINQHNIRLLHAGERNMKFIHPRVSYSLRETPEGNMIIVGEQIFTFPEPACYKCFIIPNETKK